MTTRDHRCDEPDCPCREFDATPPTGWTLDTTGPQPILTSADGHERVVLRRDGSLHATYRGVDTTASHEAAVFLLGLYEARGARQS